MTKKSLKMLLTNAGIISSKQLPADKVKDYDSELIQQNGDGTYYLLQKNDLEPSDIDTALLAKISIDIKTIKNVCIFFTVLTCISILTIIIILVRFSELVNSFSGLY